MSESKFKFKKATPKLVTEYLNIIKDLKELGKQKEADELLNGLNGGDVQTGENLRIASKLSKVLTRPLNDAEIIDYNFNLEIMKKGLSIVLESDVENLSVKELKEATEQFRKEIE